MRAISSVSSWSQSFQPRRSASCAAMAPPPHPNSRSMRDQAKHGGSSVLPFRRPVCDFFIRKTIGTIAQDGHSQEPEAVHIGQHGGLPLHRPLNQRIGLLGSARRRSAPCACIARRRSSKHLPAAPDSPALKLLDKVAQVHCVRRSSMVVTTEMPTLPPMLRARFIKPGRRVVLLARQKGIRRGVDRNKQECQPDGLNHARRRHASGNQSCRSKLVM